MLGIALHNAVTQICSIEWESLHICIQVHLQPLCYYGNGKQSWLHKVLGETKVPVLSIMTEWKIACSSLLPVFDSKNRREDIIVDVIVICVYLVPGKDFKIRYRKSLQTFLNFWPFNTFIINSSELSNSVIAEKTTRQIRACQFPTFLSYVSSKPSLICSPIYLFMFLPFGMCINSHRDS